jgi:Arc/MetJ family transcription regulator
MLYARENTVRTTLNLDEALLTDAMKWTGAATKTAAINEALQQVIQAQKRKKLIEMAGKMKLNVDLDITRKRP